MKTVLGMLLAVTAVQAQWVDLFAPPFSGTPLELMFGISCPAVGECFVAGGNSNTGFGMYKSNDPKIQTLTKVPITSPEPVLMLFGVAMQDTTHGVCGGLEIGIGGTYYTMNGKWFNESLEVGVVTTQALYNLGGHKYAYVGTDNAAMGPAVSKNGGLTFKGHWWPKNFAPNAPARYGAFPSDTTWYVTGGMWPSNNTDPNTREVTSKLTLNKKTGKLTRLSRTEPITGPVNGYGALIAKTTDGGATWTAQYNSTGEFYFNGIDCASENVCVAVAEGFAQDGATVPGVSVFMTTDGAKWDKVYSYGTSSGGSSMSVKMVSTTEAWVAATSGTGLKATGHFLHTTDGGKTWTEGAGLPFVGDVMEMSFVNATTAYAAAVTAEEVSTILALGI
eukprot:TRINITY_DN8456_c0_g1_i1.p1 TRINITY_DN8456_c0_g1~~TRINITY_DN8456_c0_g1_i1.p1  ORF type:complete len:406 (+),score=131.57 TRINITY_DN8456_c0_g1_i1:48-1220(+)